MSHLPDLRHVEVVKRGILAVAILATLTACADAAPPVGGGSDAADRLLLACDGAITQPSTQTVRARADGVHISIDNGSEQELYLDVGDYGRELRLLHTDLVLQLDPGQVVMTCRPFPMDTVAAGAGTGGTSIEVLPPEGWVSPEVTCSSGRSSQSAIDYASGATGVPDARAEAQRRAGELEVLPAGYEADRSRTFAALDGDVVVKVYSFHSDGAGGWLLGGESSCSE